MTIKTVFFDLFGVYVLYPDNEVSLNVIKSILADPKLKEKVFEFERGRVPCTEIRAPVIISHPKMAEFDDWEESDFDSYVRGTDPNILEAIHALHRHGIQTGLFCNSGFYTDKFVRSSVPRDLSVFDVVVESCRIGYRKSDPESYHIAVKMAGCCPEECVLVDDSRLNVEGAIREGMHGIHQKGEDSETAIRQLEQLLGLQLLSD